MSKEIIINSGKQTRIAIVENGDLAELFIENQEHERTIGNIFLARVRRIMPSIQAAFVDIGQKQDAFLHFSDLVENVTDWLEFVESDTPAIGQFKVDYVTRPTRKNRRRPSGHQGGSRGEGEASRHKHVADKDRTDKRRSAMKRQHAKGRGRDQGQDERDAPPVDPTTYLKKDQKILVKISKEPIANKGSRVTTDISLAGRFLVLVPMADYVAVSKKIQSFKERRRLRALANSLLPEGFGVIVRTVASGKNAKSLDTDLNLLLDKWRKIESKLSKKPKAPAELHVDVNMASSIMRDLFTDDYDRILIDDHRTFKNIKGYVQAIAPQMADAVHEYTGSDPVFKSAGIDKQVEEAFESRVNLPSGGYLFIEQTEAMHVVDVNSGRSGRGMSQEDSSLKVNVEAAHVIAQQVRLRDLGGIIVVDFIDMRHERNRKKVYDEIRNEFRKDRAVTKVLPMSDFGLMQITRQRLRPSITKTFSLPEDDNSAPGQRREYRPAERTESPSSSTSSQSRTPVASSAGMTPDDLLAQMEKWIEAYLSSGRRAGLKLVVHPFTAAFLNKRIPNQTTRWFLRHLLRVRVVADSGMDPLDFRFLDAASGEEASTEAKEKKAPPTKSSASSRDTESKRDDQPKRDARSKRDAQSSREPSKERRDGKEEASDSDASSASEGRGRGGSRSGSRGGGRGRGRSGDDENRGRGRSGDDENRGRGRSGDDENRGRGRSGDDENRGRGRSGNDENRGRGRSGNDSNGRGRSTEEETPERGRSSENGNRGRGRGRSGDDDNRGRGRSRSDASEGTVTSETPDAPRPSSRRAPKKQEQAAPEQAAPEQAAPVSAEKDIRTDTPQQPAERKRPTERKDTGTETPVEQEADASSDASKSRGRGRGRGGRGRGRGGRGRSTGA
ncbi:MAG: Rne/Rng family ribonuclease [Rhodothermales bacterium]